MPTFEYPDYGWYMEIECPWLAFTGHTDNTVKSLFHSVTCFNIKFSSHGKIPLIPEASDKANNLRRTEQLQCTSDCGLHTTVDCWDNKNFFLFYRYIKNYIW